MFGDAQVHEAQREARDEVLESVHDDTYTIVITHSGDWKDPQHARYRDLELVETFPDEEQPWALVELRDPAGWIPCPAGHYRLAPDDTIGASASVLAVVGDAVLLELEGELSYLLMPGADHPVWRMAYHPPWRFPVPLSASAPPKPSSGKKRRR